MLSSLTMGSAMLAGMICDGITKSINFHLWLARFLSLDTIDILVQIIICGGELLCAL